MLELVKVTIKIENTLLKCAAERRMSAVSTLASRGTSVQQRSFTGTNALLWATMKRKLNCRNQRPIHLPRPAASFACLDRLQKTKAAGAKRRYHRDPENGNDVKGALFLPHNLAVQI